MKTRVKLLIAIVASSLATATVLVGGGGFWISHVWTEYTDVVWRAPYRVVIPGDPAVSGTIYRLDRRAAYLVVLTSRSSKRPEAYYIDFVRQEIGLAEFRQYVPFGRFALVDRETLDGIYSEAAIEAAWDMEKKWKEMRIRIKGFATHTYAGYDAPKREQISRALIPLGYQRELVVVHQ